MPFIYLTGDYSERVGDQPIELKGLVQQTVGTHVRRVDRFIQLALIGAAKCADKSLPPDTAVFLASGRGDLEVTLEVLEQLFVQGQPPKPLSFINTVSNAACYYIAQQLKLQSRSSFVCNRYFAFESVLQLALLDLEHGVITSALVGAVDVVVPPVARHRKHLGIGEDVATGEASHWLWLASHQPDLSPLGELIAADHHADEDALMSSLQRRALPPNTAISRGQFIPEHELQRLQHKLGLQKQFDYLNGRAYYDSQSAAAISAFLVQAEPGQTLLHINADPAGRYSSFIVRRNPPS